ncbi:cytochrome-c peroxidase [Aquimarina sp. 2201CG14-23]|uniref:cytochrome-c peroxidase n=1 Tax=Aquimarina mycalae TaxID=3040073 RepID=UPI002477D84E|nr:cytochrome c peroxidase [Aquimarina sp. 2201CG14-23]MDH7445821.1 cytochrome c peroxidase [Aquimarina sp. 2201CG14-23]
MQLLLNFSNKGAYLRISLFVLLIVSSCSKEVKVKTEKIPFITVMQKQFGEDITLAISYLDSIKQYPSESGDRFKEVKTSFKKIEPVLSVLDVENYGFLNQPNILKVEEEDFTDIKIKSPSGYQVLEEEIFTDQIDTLSIIKHVNLITNRLKLIKKNTSFNHLKQYHFLWLLRKAITRVALTGITGFDSPVLENSLEESKIVYQSLSTYLSIFETEFNDENLFKSWNTEIKATLNNLEGDFNEFDRYHFIKNHTHKQLNLWNQTVTDWQVVFPFELALKNNATSLFSSDTFNVNYFADQGQKKIPSEKISLGKKLFYDANLSANKMISCATCHQPEKAFTDGLKISKGVTRNSPTLLYAALQQAFFYDKRAGGLEGQIINVIENENEFHSNLETLEKVVKTNKVYVKEFSKVYPNREINNNDIRNAIASYIRSLTPFNSKFDRNINGIENSLTINEINGYNLFNGKAKCATCHFAPLFNGTVPPDYKESEIELIGVPATNDTVNAIISKDLGRYEVYKTPERKHFFKTPTVRNSGKTGPYMHNGVYNTLEEVMDFYNRGGGAGIGIDLQYQTLPSDRLNLTEQEINDIIAFIKSLNDNTIDY